MPERRVNWLLVVLLYGMGVPTREIAERCDCHPVDVPMIWRRRAEVIGGPRDV